MPTDPSRRGIRPDVWLVRHGETAWNVEGRIQGHTDVPLSEHGVEQARRLADRLAWTPPARIVSSDLLRAFATASEVARRLGLDVVRDAALREQNLGGWQGLTAAEAGQLHPDLFARRFLARDPAARPPEGETLQEMQGRAWDALDRHAGPGSTGPLLVVTHGGVLSSLVYRALGLSTSSPRRFLLPNAALTTLVWRDDGWRLATLNDVGHVPRAPGETTFPFD